MAHPHAVSSRILKGHTPVRPLPAERCREFLFGESGFEWQDAVLFWNYYGASKSAILTFDNVTDRTVNHEGADANIQNVFLNLWMNDMYQSLYLPQVHFPTPAFREHNQLAKDWK